MPYEDGHSALSPPEAENPAEKMALEDGPPKPTTSLGASTAKDRHPPPAPKFLLIPNPLPLAFQATSRQCHRGPCQATSWASLPQPPAHALSKMPHCPAKPQEMEAKTWDKGLLALRASVSGG